MNPLSTWTYYHRHKHHASLLIGLSLIVTVGLYSMVALVWGAFVEQPRLAYMALSKFSVVTLWSDENGKGVIDRIKANPEVAQVIPTTTITIQIPGIMSGDSFPFDLFGLPEKELPFILERLGANLIRGRLPAPGENELLLSEDVAAMLDVQVGELYDILSSEFYVGVDVPVEPTPFEVVGVVESELELVFASLEYLDKHSLYRNFPNRFLVVAQENREAAVDAFLRSEIHSLQTPVRTLSTLNERILNEALPGLIMLLPVILIISVALALVIVVVNQIANAQRLPEFGILHAVGLSKNWLTRKLTLETTLLALIGWVTGIGISWLALYMLRVTYFAARGYDFRYIVWIPIVFALLLPVVVAGFTFVSVKRTFIRLDPVAIVEQRELSQEGDQKRALPASHSSYTPMSAATFYNRHRRRALLLISGMSMMILAVILFIFALAVNADAQVPFLGYLSRVSIVNSPGVVSSLDPGVVKMVDEHPAVERIIPIAPRSTILKVSIPPFTIAEASPVGVYEEDMAYLVELYNLELKEGRLPLPGTNEMVVSEALAQNRGLEVGDMVGNPDMPVYPGAPSLPVEFIVSGIFAQPDSPEDGSGWSFISLEFLETSQIFPLPEVLPLIVVPKAGYKDALDDWLENELAGQDASVLTYRQEVAHVQAKAQQDMLGIALLEGVLVIVAALGLGVLNYIFTSQRQTEFGILHALGYSRRRLVGRVFAETAFMTVVAMGSSGLIALVGMLILRFVVFNPIGLKFDLLTLTPWLYMLPIPIAVLAVTAGTTARTLSKLDPISIIERRL